MHMRTASKLILTALAAAALMALASTGVPARNFIVTERNFEYIWNNTLTGKGRLVFADAAGQHIECNVTMLGRFNNQTIAKAVGTNIGGIFHAVITTPCTGGEVSFSRLPEVRYIGFTGTLPNIGTITFGLIGLTATIREALGPTCVIRTEALEPAVFIAEGNPWNAIRADETRRIAVGVEFCSFISPIHLAGKGLIRNLPRTAQITVTLI